MVRMRSWCALRVCKRPPPPHTHTHTMHRKHKFSGLCGAASMSTFSSGWCQLLGNLHHTAEVERIGWGRKFEKDSFIWHANGCWWP